MMPTDRAVAQPSPARSADPVETEPAPPAAPRQEDRAPEPAQEPTLARAGVVGEGRADQLHLVAAAARSGQEAEQMTDQAAIALIRRLDKESQSGPVSRRTIEKAVGCGASRATRLTDLARSGQETRPQKADLDRQTA